MTIPLAPTTLRPLTLAMNPNAPDPGACLCDVPDWQLGAADDLLGTNHRGGPLDDVEAEQLLRMTEASALTRPCHVWGLRLVMCPGSLSSQVTRD